jgi:hypothetical protein
LAEVLDPRDKGDDVEEDVGLEDGEDVEVFLAVVELRVEGGWLVGRTRGGGTGGDEDLRRGGRRRCLR